MEKGFKVIRLVQKHEIRSKSALIFFHPVLPHTHAFDEHSEKSVGHNMGMEFHFS